MVNTLLYSQDTGCGPERLGHARSSCRLPLNQAFLYALGLPLPSAPVLSALTSVQDTSQAIADIVALPEVQAADAPIVQMFELATGPDWHLPTLATLSSIASSDLTQSQLATAFVASQTFANNYNGGTLVNPDAPVSADLVDALFINSLGHAPSVATAEGFMGLTNGQEFLEFATSPTMTAAQSNNVNATLTLEIELTTGIPSAVQPTTQVQIVGQGGHAVA
jgi:hypothetical protein